MLLSEANRRGDMPTELDTVHNYYERLVWDEIQKKLPDDLNNTDYIADIACVALNHLPPRYIRYAVDMAFYLSPNERHEMMEKVIASVDKAIEFVNKSNVHSHSE